MMCLFNYTSMLQGSRKYFGNYTFCQMDHPDSEVVMMLVEEDINVTTALLNMKAVCL